MASQGYEAATGPAAQMDATVHSDLEKWGRVVKAAEIQLEYAAHKYRLCSVVLLRISLNKTNLGKSP